MKKPKRYWEVLAVGKKIYSTKKEKPRLGCSFAVMVILMAAMLLVGTSFRSQSAAKRQKDALAAKAKAAAQWKRDYDTEYATWHFALHLENMDLGVKLGMAGGGPKTEEEVKQKSFTLKSEVEAQAPSTESVQGATAGDTHYYSGDELEQRKWAWVAKQLQAIKEADIKASRHAIQVALVNGYLEGTPMAGQGELMVSNAERTGVKVYLCCVQAEAESSRGLACFRPYNAWGMMGHSFGSWEEGVAAYFDNVVAHWGPAQSAYEMPGYCVPDHPYMEHVQSVVDWFNAQEEAAMAPVYARYQQ